MQCVNAEPTCQDDGGSTPGMLLTTAFIYSGLVAVFRGKDSSKVVLD